MRSFHQLVFDDYVEGTTAAYTQPQLNELLAMTEMLEVVAVAAQASGTTPTLTIEVQASPDNRNWVTITPAVVSAASLSTSAQTIAGGVSSADLRSGFTRLQITLGGTSPKAQLRIHVTGRGEQIVAI